MISRINRLLTVLTFVALALYVVLKNRGPAYIYLTERYQYETSIGLAIIVAVIFGILMATLVASYFAFRSYLRERALKSSLKFRTTILSKIHEARGANAAGNYDSARIIWEQIIKKDSANPIARLEVAKNLEQANDLASAISSIDIARRHNPENIELLIYAAELHTKNKNLTAALDHLGLVLKKTRSKKIALQAAELAAELGRFDQSTEYLNLFDQFGGHAPEVAARIEYKKLISETADRPDDLYRGLHDLTKRFPQSKDALSHLGTIEADNNRFDAAAQYFIKAAKLSGQLSDWTKAIDVWVKAEKPDRALAVAKAARAETKGDSRLHAELITLRLQLLLALLADALKTIEAFPALASNQTIAPSKEVWSEFYGLKAWYFNLIGNFAESSEALKTLNNLYLGVTPTLRGPGILIALENGPSPILSTP